MSGELKIAIPSATDVRKAGATAAAKFCTEAEAKIVHRQFAHDSRVAAQYYEAIKGTKDAKSAYDTLQRIGEEKLSSRRLWTDKETDVIKEKFLSNVNSAQTPSLLECKDIFKDKTAKQVQDKVRTLIRNEKKKY